MCMIQDYGGELLQGTFYPQEIQKVAVTKDKLYKIESIHREQKSGRCTQCLVKWEGYPASFNSCISMSELKTYKG